MALARCAAPFRCCLDVRHNVLFGQTKHDTDLIEVVVILEPSTTRLAEVDPVVVHRLHMLRRISVVVESLRATLAFDLWRPMSCVSSVLSYGPI